MKFSLIIQLIMLVNTQARIITSFFDILERVNVEKINV